MKKFEPADDSQFAPWIVEPTSSSPGIRIIDSGYIREDFAAAYLLETEEGAAIVETNTARAVPRLLHALDVAGVAREDVRYIIVTHAHLDHAGGVGTLMKECPHATLLAHPRAARHLIDPTKLEASARHVYGDAIFSKLYREILPVPQARVRILEDGEELAFGSASLCFLHTRGHANHHFCVLERATSSIFTGDTFGLRYPDLNTPQLFVYPSTSPTDFDPIAAVQSVRRIVATGARRALLTHYGAIDDLDAAAAQLIERIKAAGELLLEAERELVGGADPGKLATQLKSKVRAEAERGLRAAGLTDSADAERALDAFLSMDIELNAAGLVAAAQKKLSS